MRVAEVKIVVLRRFEVYASAQQCPPSWSPGDLPEMDKLRRSGLRAGHAALAVPFPVGEEEETVATQGSAQVKAKLLTAKERIRVCWVAA